MVSAIASIHVEEGQPFLQIGGLRFAAPCRRVGRAGLGARSRQSAKSGPVYTQGAAANRMRFD